MGDRGLTVGIDDQIFRRQPWGGISRIFVEMAKVWSAHHGDVDARPLFRVARSTMVAGAFPGVRVLDLPDNPLGARAFAILNHQSARALGHCDVLQHTYFDRRCLRPVDKPRVTHIYDMIDETAGVAVPQWFDKRAFAEASDLVICISEATRSALLATWPLDPDKVKTVLLAASPSLGHPVPRPPGLPERYLLYVGNRGAYKNFRLLVEACASAPELMSQLKLHILAVGGGPFSAAETELLAGAGLHERARQVDVSEADLPAYYQHAAVVVQTSAAEGFGLPVLEGMAAGTPVLAADLSVVREVAEDAICYFTSGSVSSLAASLVEILSSQPLRDELGRRGVDRARGFSWARTARETAALYAEARERHGIR